MSLSKEQVYEIVEEKGPIDPATIAGKTGADVDEVWNVMADLQVEEEVEHTEDGFEVPRDPFDLQVKADLEEEVVPINGVVEFSADYGNPTRVEILERLLPHFEIETYCTGGYQGTYVFRLDGPEYVWLIRDSYGSCSLCDGLIDNDDPYGYGISMVRNAYAFESDDAVLEFLNLVDNYRWERVKKGAKNLFRDS